MNAGTDQIRFDDGASYERYMGVWSQLVGAAFLEWLALPTGRRWLDVGCGNGAFTELLALHGAPAAVHGVDPSAAQLVFAQQRPALRDADLRDALSELDLTPEQAELMRTMPASRAASITLMTDWCGAWASALMMSSGASRP